MKGREVWWWSGEECVLEEQPLSQALKDGEDLDRWRTGLEEFLVEGIRWRETREGTEGVGLR